MTTTSVFANSTLAAMSPDDVISHVASAQVKTAKAMDNYHRKTRKEFAVLMLEARTLIKQIEANVDVKAQATLLTRHQIKAAAQGTSAYTPWIKLVFGKSDPDGKKAKFGGEEHVKWTPDASFARYFNFYEFIDREFTGSEDELLDFVLEHKGPATIVAKELARKREAENPSEDTVQAQRDLYMEEAQMPFLDIPSDALGNAEGFVGVILQRTADGVRLVGITKADASADFDRLAASSFDALIKGKAEREAAAQRENELNEAMERGAREQSERMAASMGLSVEQMRERLRLMAEEVRDHLANAADQKAAD